MIGFLTALPILAVAVGEFLFTPMAVASSAPRDCGISTCSCELPIERKILDALINRDHEKASALVNGANWDGALIPSSPFYKGIVRWSRGVYFGNSDEVNSGVSMLKKTIQKLKKAHKQRPGAQTLLSVALASAHTSRILLHRGHHLSGFRMGAQSLRYVEQYLRHPNATEYGKAASQLVLGLNQVYLNGIPNKLRYLYHLSGASINSGDISLSQGKALIKQAMVGSPHFGSEAARSLLTEVPWSKPDICQNMALAEWMAKRYPGNPGFSALSQGFSIRCGKPFQALKQNTITLQYLDQRTKSQQTEPSRTKPRGSGDWKMIFQKGRYRALADLGRVEQLAKMTANEALEPYRMIALANALDLKLQRNQALEIYNTVLNYPEGPKSVTRSAMLRLRHPYTSPVKVSGLSSTPIPNC